ncbi:MAG: acetamidase/formamidase family protein [Actinomycetota bacterium]
MQTIGREHHVFSYSADHPSVAKLVPGESVLVETTYAFGDQPLGPGDTLADIDLAICDPLTGPLYVETAAPGDTLAVYIETVEPTDAGAQGVIPDFGVLEWDRLPLHFFTPEGNRVKWLRGLEYEMRPNVGAIGVAPQEGEIPSVYPGDHGGNMDMKHIRAGSTVLLPVWHPGAILFVGDCHQRQGDGELPGCVAETNARVTLSVDVVKGQTIKRPRVLTEDRLMLVASAKTLDEAVKIAVRDTVDMLMEEKGFDEDDAYLFTGIWCDAEICQVVDPLKTARVAMDRGFYESLQSA